MPDGVQVENQIKITDADVAAANPSPVDDGIRILDPDRQKLEADIKMGQTTDAPTPQEATITVGEAIPVTRPTTSDAELPITVHADRLPSPVSAPEAIPTAPSQVRVVVDTPAIPENVSFPARLKQAFVGLFRSGRVVTSGGPTPLSPEHAAVSPVGPVASGLRETSTVSAPRVSTINGTEVRPDPVNFGLGAGVETGRNATHSALPPVAAEANPVVAQTGADVVNAQPEVSAQNGDLRLMGFEELQRTLQEQGPTEFRRINQIVRPISNDFIGIINNTDHASLASEIKRGGLGNDAKAEYKLNTTNSNNTLTVSVARGRVKLSESFTSNGNTMSHTYEVVSADNQNGRKIYKNGLEITAPQEAQEIWNKFQTLTREVILYAKSNLSTDTSNTSIQ